MKCFFQLIETATGYRSSPVGFLRDEFANTLKKQLETNPALADDIVLVLVDDADATDWEFSTAPLMKVSTFVEHFATTEA